LECLDLVADFLEYFPSERRLGRFSRLGDPGDGFHDPAGPLLAGRVFELLDEDRAPRVAVVDHCCHRISPLEGETLHRPTHSAVESLEADLGFVELEEPVEDTPLRMDHHSHPPRETTARFI